MNAVTIMKGKRFALVSYGNGLAYALDDLFVQGDDALEFRTELDAYEVHHPYADGDQVLYHMLSTYQ